MSVGVGSLANSRSVVVGFNFVGWLPTRDRETIGRETVLANPLYNQGNTILLLLSCHGSS
jgi:hypothetical protein